MPKPRRATPASVAVESLDDDSYNRIAREFTRQSLAHALWVYKHGTQTDKMTLTRQFLGEVAKQFGSRATDDTAREVRDRMNELFG